MAPWIKIKEIYGAQPSNDLERQRKLAAMFR
jgi:hypothetical protein